MQQATHIYRNGTILTMDSRCSIVSCLAVSGETILAVGSEAEVAPFQGPETRIVDLGGRFMMPGFYDCHSHFMRAGMYNKYYLDVNSHPIGDVRTHGDIRRKVREALSGMPAGEWLLCAGYDDTAVAEERHFTLAELDAMAPDHPLFLRHISGHLALCNSKAFEAAGITDETLNPSGGVFRHDGNGRLTGLVEEPAAMDMVLEASPQMTEEKWLGAVELATDDYVAKGVTTAHDGGVTTAMWKNYMTAHKRGMLKNRVQLLLVRLLAGPHRAMRHAPDQGRPAQHGRCETVSGREPPRVHRLSEQSLPFAAGRHLRRVMARIPHLQSP